MGGRLESHDATCQPASRAPDVAVSRSQSQQLHTRGFDAHRPVGVPKVFTLSPSALACRMKLRRAHAAFIGQHCRFRRRQDRSLRLGMVLGERVATKGSRSRLHRVSCGRTPAPVHLSSDSFFRYFRLIFFLFLVCFRVIVPVPRVRLCTKGRILVFRGNASCREKQQPASPAVATTPADGLLLRMARDALLARSRRRQTGPRRSRATPLPMPRQCRRPPLPTIRWSVRCARR